MNQNEEEDKFIIESLGDSLFQSIPLETNEIQEREEMVKYPQYFSKEKITAFTLSMKSLHLLYNQRIPEANDLSMRALKFDINSIDSFQILIQTASFFIDNETKISLYIQLVSLYKSQLIKNQFFKIQSSLKNRIERRKIQRKIANTNESKSVDLYQQNEFTNQNQIFDKSELKKIILKDNEKRSDDQNFIQLVLQPYFRLLFSLGETSSLGDNPVLWMQCYEEVLRLDHSNKFAANNLVVSYIKIIGMRKRGIHSIPKRTMWHLKILLEIYDSLLEEEVKFCGKLVMSYYYKNKMKKIDNNNNLSVDCNGVIYDSRDCWEGLKEWKDVTKEFHKQCPKSVSFIFMEESGKSEFPLIPAFQEWLDLVVDMHEVLYGKSDSFYNYIHKKNEKTDVFRSRKGKQVMAKAANEHLEKARESLRRQNYINTINECTVAKKMFTEANYPSNKWYLNSPFPVLSNRAVACFHLELWIVVLRDTRFTLAMNPKHQKSYLLMKKVAAVFGCIDVEKKLDQIYQKVMQNKLSDKDWNALAKKAIALLSLKALALSKEGMLNESNIEHLMKVGIEDCFTELPFSTMIVPHLQWINE